ncbi:pentatricopeptide repeat-containing protein At1g80150, mitochondrial isoform X1 [Punica granatum]|uniref:Pentatricopeptide repeat-containing protein At1g80150, mitochondrial isoform X1 n=1 Tax=Punica granatum TaxID=22663 RepID=A0A6P8CDG9_PUNGR|nr:pentatricopeptide repeat-containing protein At1g80150, mitochondrial isoform X1 [Punica granatum]
MLSLRPSRRLCHSAAAAAISCVNSSATVSSSVQNPKRIEEPALIKLKSERDPEKLFHLFKANAHNRLVVENRFAFEDTVSRLAGAGRFDYIEELLEQQKALPQGRREGFIVRIIMLYGKAGMIKQSVDTFSNMHLFGCKRTVKSFNATLQVLVQTRDLEAIQAFFLEMPSKFHVELDVISLNIVIKALCEMCVLDRAYSIMVEMERVGIRPDVVTYTTLISAFYKSNRGEVGNGLWNLMVLKSCLPNLATFNVRVQYLVNRHRAWEANRLLKVMIKIRMKPDEVTYNLVIKGFFLIGDLKMAKRVYSALHGNGYKPNMKIYQTMIHYLCREDSRLSMKYVIMGRAPRRCWTLQLFVYYPCRNQSNQKKQPSSCSSEGLDFVGPFED